MFWKLATLLMCCFLISPPSRAAANVRGINWFGLETEQHRLEGLDVFSLETHVQRMASFGFNAIRVPFAMEGVVSGLYRETDAYDTLHALFVETQRHNISILLDLHRLFFHTTNPLWHSSRSVTIRGTNLSVEMSETNVLAGWEVVLSAFGHYPNLLGIDLYNEPHGDASFHTGNKSTDFQLFVERACRQLGPKIFITGIPWGQDMRGYHFLNVSREKIVMAPHVYGPTLTAIPGGDGWKTDPTILEYRWNHYFGYLATPSGGGWAIVVGEFGASEYNQDDMIWLSHFVHYLQKHPGWGWMYWAWNPGSHDVQGFLESDWKTPVPSKFKILSKLLDAPRPA